MTEHADPYSPHDPATNAPSSSGTPALRPGRLMSTGRGWVRTGIKQRYFCAAPHCPGRRLPPVAADDDLHEKCVPHPHAITYARALDIAREVMPEATDDALGWAIWNETGFPEFFDGDSETVLREQLASFEAQAKGATDYPPDPADPASDASSGTWATSPPGSPAESPAWTVAPEWTVSSSGGLAESGRHAVDPDLLICPACGEPCEFDADRAAEFARWVHWIPTPDGKAPEDSPPCVALVAAHKDGALRWAVFHVVGDLSSTLAARPAWSLRGYLPLDVADVLPSELREVAP